MFASESGQRRISKALLDEVIEERGFSDDMAVGAPKVPEPQEADSNAYTEDGLQSPVSSDSELIQHDDLPPLEVSFASDEPVNHQHEASTPSNRYRKYRPARIAGSS